MERIASLVGQSHLRSSETGAAGPGGRVVGWQTMQEKCEESGEQ